MSDYKELLSRIAYCTNEESCDGCPLDSGNILRYCVDELLRKAADAIEQLCTDVSRLEAENRAKEQYIAETIGKVIKERDAAVADIEKYCRYCIVCKNADFTDGYRHNRCRKCLDEENRYFEWRGVREVEHEAD